MTEEEYLTLKNEVIKWLGSSPARDDIYFYYTHLPSEYFPVAQEACKEAIDIANAKYRNYYTKIGITNFDIMLGFHDQILIARLLQELKENPENKKIILNTFPDFVKLVAGKNLTNSEERSKEYIAVWESAILLYSCENYIQARTYAKTILNLSKTPEEIKEKKQKIQDIIIFQAKNIEADSNPSENELHDHYTSLNELGFLPESIVKELVYRSRDDYYDDDNSILSLILDVLIFINEFGFEEAKKDSSAFEYYVWSNYANRIEDLFVLYYERQRVNRYSEGRDDISKVVEFLAELWVNNRVFTGEAEVKTIEYFSKLNDEQQELFKDAFLIFISKSVYFSILLDGFDLDYVIYRTIHCQSQTQLTGIITEIISAVQDKKKKELIGKYLFGIYRVMHHQSAIKGETLSPAAREMFLNKPSNINSINNYIKIFGQENIASGATMTLLRDYYSTLHAEDQKQFISNLEKFLCGSLEISTIMSPLSIRSYLDGLKTLSKEQKKDYTNKLLAGNTFRDKQLTEKLMQILVNLF